MCMRFRIAPTRGVCGGFGCSCRCSAFSVGRPGRARVSFSASVFMRSWSMVVCVFLFPTLYVRVGRWAFAYAVVLASPFIYSAGVVSGPHVRHVKFAP